MVDPLSRVTLTGEDFESLEEGEYVTDAPIEFWMSRIQTPHNVALANAFMVVLLESEQYEATDTAAWRRLFLDHKFVAVPIHLRDHWSLAIVIRNGSEFVVLHVDSLGTLHTRRRAVEPLLAFLRDIPGVASVRVYHLGTLTPQQPNKFDCALFMLTAMQRLCTAARDQPGAFDRLPAAELEAACNAKTRKDARLAKMAEAVGPSLFSAAWFTQEDAMGLRGRILAAVDELRIDAAAAAVASASSIP